MKRLTLEDLKKRYETETMQILDVEIRETGNKKKKETFVKYKCLIDGYEDWIRQGSLYSGKRCKKCSNQEKLTINTIKERLKEINPNIQILSRKYINANTDLLCMCKLDNHEWSATWNNLSHNHGCPLCCGRIVCDKNRLSLLRPDLVKYFPIPEDAYNYSVGSSKKVQLKCPECGELKNKPMTIYRLCSQGFSCPICSDGISIPEKFGICLLKELGINFETQKTFKWSQKRRYDKYFLFKNNEYIIEVHGEQHYVQQHKNSKIKTKLKEQQENDLLKHRLAIENGIKSENYIIIDCRKSEFEWLKENFIKSLGSIFDLSNVDWLKIWTNCNSSLIIKTCSLWNDLSDDNFTTTKLGEIIGLCRHTVSKYLKIGAKIGLCDYNSKIEMRKNGSRNSKNRKNTKTKEN